MRRCLSRRQPAGSTSQCELSRCARLSIRTAGQPEPVTRLRSREVERQSRRRPDTARPTRTPAARHRQPCHVRGRPRIHATQVQHARDAPKTRAGLSNTRPRTRPGPRATADPVTRPTSADTTMRCCATANAITTASVEPSRRWLPYVCSVDSSHPIMCLLSLENGLALSLPTPSPTFRYDCDWRDNS